MWSDLTLGPSIMVKLGQPNLKVLITYLLLVLEVFNVKPTYRKSWARNLMWSDLTLGPSFNVKMKITKLKSVCSSIVIGPRSLQCEIKL